MCGIVGFISKGEHNSPKPERKQICTLMANTLNHRGPDSSGIWVDDKINLSMGHKRLSIIDVSKNGAQPMKSKNRRYIIVYNGEIYNYLELRQDIESTGYKFIGSSDTEVILGGIELWGIKVVLNKIRGMYAFALWDKGKRKLHLVRDRIGEKPLYYGWVNSAFIFGSELKALKVFPGWHGSVDRDSLALYLQYLYIPTPDTIYKGIYKLAPGKMLTLNYDNINKRQVELENYWSLDQFTNKCYSNDTIIRNKFEELLRDSIKSQMISDVPLGAFLSGGLDSSLIVSIMQSLSKRPIKTFTMGFYDKKHNEAKHAREIAEYLKTDHTEHYVTPREALDVVPLLAEIYDEPFADSSQIPTYLLSKLARNDVSVCLTGDGGDELFAGYDRYYLGENIWKYSKYIPEIMRNKISLFINTVASEPWGDYFNKGKMSVENQLRLAEYLSASSSSGLYNRIVSHWFNSTDVVIGAINRPPIFKKTNFDVKSNNFIDSAMTTDIESFLPDDILVKVDRATMSVSLESRAPLLDHRIVEFSKSIPFNVKYRDGKTKWILRELLNTYLPQKLTGSPKRGFTIPLDVWLRGPLKSWANSYLQKERLSSEGYFNSSLILNKWHEHIAGKRNWQHQIWAILMFETWLENE